LDGVYLSDSIAGAALWKAVQMQNQTVAVVEVEVDERAIREGEDHSPEMQARFGAGKSFVSTKNIPSKSSYESISERLRKKPNRKVPFVNVRRLGNSTNGCALRPGTK